MLLRHHFQQLTGIDPRDGEAVMAWQAAHGLAPTGQVRLSTVRAARAVQAPDGEASDTPARADTNSEKSPPLVGSGAAAPDDALDVAAAEDYNRQHIVDVVRFDGATHGRFAKPNGELDATRVAEWQSQHELPADGKVTENSCLVAEGKPPLPERPRFDGQPTIGVLQPIHALQYAAQLPIPLLVHLRAKPGKKATVQWELQAPAGMQVASGSEVVPSDFDGSVMVAVRIPPPSGVVIVSDTACAVRVSADVEGEHPTPVTQPLILTASNLPPVVPGEIGPSPPPAPKPPGGAIDQASAEAYNRAHPYEVVRFDRATHGHYAKPNGELDALDVAEWQRQHGLPPTGMIDSRTASLAERQTPASKDGMLFEGAPFATIDVAPDWDTHGVPKNNLAVQVTGRPHSSAMLHWGLAVPRVGFGLGPRGVEAVMLGDDGTGLAVVPMPTMKGATSCELEVAAINSYGAGPISKQLIMLPPQTPDFGDDDLAY